MGITIDESIKFMTKDFASLRWNNSSKNPNFFNKIQLSQLLSSWDKHVMSWIDVKWTVPKLIIKYEDLVYKKNLF